MSTSSAVNPIKARLALYFSKQKDNPETKKGKSRVRKFTRQYAKRTLRTIEEISASSNTTADIGRQIAFIDAVIAAERIAYDCIHSGKVAKLKLQEELTSDAEDEESSAEKPKKPKTAPTKKSPAV
jgi:hypothetical protein